MISRPLLAAALIAATPAAAMPSFELSGGGVSAVRDLDVGGTLYDVDLGDGGCVELFDGCDGNADFLLPTAAQADALLAALDAVFADPTPIGGLLYDLDTPPSLTEGCEDADTCLALLPHEIDGAGGVAVRAWADGTATGPESLLGNTVTPDRDRAVFDFRTYAVVSPAPDATAPPPAGAPPLPAALGALALRARRRGRNAPRRAPEPPARRGLASRPAIA